MSYLNYNSLLYEELTVEENTPSILGVLAGRWWLRVALALHLRLRRSSRARRPWICTELLGLVGLMHDLTIRGLTVPYVSIRWWCSLNRSAIGSRITIIDSRLRLVPSVHRSSVLIRFRPTLLDIRRVSRWRLTRDRWRWLLSIVLHITRSRRWGPIRRLSRRRIAWGALGKMMWLLLNWLHRLLWWGRWLRGRRWRLLLDRSVTRMTTILLILVSIRHRILHYTTIRPKGDTNRVRTSRSLLVR